MTAGHMFVVITCLKFLVLKIIYEYVQLWSILIFIRETHFSPWKFSFLDLPNGFHTCAHHRPTFIKIFNIVNVCMTFWWEVGIVCWSPQAENGFWQTECFFRFPKNTIILFSHHLHQIVKYIWYSDRKTSGF